MNIDKCPPFCTLASTPADDELLVYESGFVDTDTEQNSTRAVFFYCWPPFQPPRLAGTQGSENWPAHSIPFWQCVHNENPLRIPSNMTKKTTTVPRNIVVFPVASWLWRSLLCFLTKKWQPWSTSGMKHSKKCARTSALFYWSCLRLCKTVTLVFVRFSELSHLSEQCWDCTGTQLHIHSSDNWETTVDVVV